MRDLIILVEHQSFIMMMSLLQKFWIFLQLFYYQFLTNISKFCVENFAAKILILILLSTFLILIFNQHTKVLSWRWKFCRKFFSTFLLLILNQHIKVLSWWWEFCCQKGTTISILPLAFSNLNLLFGSKSWRRRPSHLFWSCV